MPDADGPVVQRRLNQALVYALTGETPDPSGGPSAPDVAKLARELLVSRGGPVLWAYRRNAVSAGAPWPHPVPPELMVGLGYARFGAALTRLLRELDLGEPGVVAPTAAATDASTAMTQDVRRLLDEVPPHHGS